MHPHNPALTALTHMHHGKIVRAADAVRLIRDGDTVATGGFVGIGFAEEVAIVLEERYVGSETGYRRWHLVVEIEPDLIRYWYRLGHRAAPHGLRRPQHAPRAAQPMRATWAGPVRPGRAHRSVQRRARASTAGSSVSSHRDDERSPKDGHERGQASQPPGRALQLPVPRNLCLPAPSSPCPRTSTSSGPELVNSGNDPEAEIALTSMRADPTPQRHSPNAEPTA